MHNDSDEEICSSEQNDYLGPLMDQSDDNVESLKNNKNQNGDDSSSGDEEAGEQLISLFPPFKRKNSQLEIQLKPPFIYRKKKAKLIKFSNLGSFGLIKCENITTYFLGMVACSQFTNPEQVENNKELNVKFLYRGNKNRSNGIGIKGNNEVFKLPPDFKIDKIELSKMKHFITAVNQFFYTSEYMQTVSEITTNKKLRCILIFIMFCIIIGCFWFLGNDVYKLIRGEISIDYLFLIKNIGLSVVIILLLFLSKRSIGKLLKVPFRFLEETISYRIKHAEEVEEFIEKWNEELFIGKHVRIWIPASLDYVMFNSDLYQNIQMESHYVEESNTDLL